MTVLDFYNKRYRKLHKIVIARGYMQDFSLHEARRRAISTGYILIQRPVIRRVHYSTFCQ